MTTTMEPIAHADVSKAWLEEVFRQGGYEVTETGTGNQFKATKQGEPIWLVQYVPGPGIISFRKGYKMKVGGFGAKKDMVHGVETANRDSWVDTYYLDNESDLWVSSYIFVTDRISGADVLRFLAAEQAGFMLEVTKTGLIKYST